MNMDSKEKKRRKKKKQRPYKRDVGRNVPRNLPCVDTRVKNVEEGEVQLKILAWKMTFDSTGNLGKKILLPIFKEFEVWRKHLFVPANEQVG